MNIEDIRLTPEELNEVYEKTKKLAYEFSETYEGTLSPKNYHPDRPADRERQFCISRKETLMENSANAATDKAIEKLIEMSDDFSLTACGRVTFNFTLNIDEWQALKKLVEGR